MAEGTKGGNGKDDAKFLKENAEGLSRTAQQSNFFQLDSPDREDG